MAVVGALLVGALLVEEVQSFNEKTKCRCCGGESYGYEYCSEDCQDYMEIGDGGLEEHERKNHQVSEM